MQKSSIRAIEEAAKGATRNQRRAGERVHRSWLPRRLLDLAPGVNAGQAEISQLMIIHSAEQSALPGARAPHPPSGNSTLVERDYAFEQ